MVNAARCILGISYSITIPGLPRVSLSLFTAHKTWQVIQECYRIENVERARLIMSFFSLPDFLLPLIARRHGEMYLIDLSYFINDNLLRLMLLERRYAILKGEKGVTRKAYGVSSEICHSSNHSLDFCWGESKWLNDLDNTVNKNV